MGMADLFTLGPLFLVLAAGPFRSGTMPNCRRCFVHANNAGQPLFLGKEPPPDDHPQHGEYVVGLDLLAFGVGPAMVIDRHFVGDAPFLHHPAKDLRMLLPSLRNQAVLVEQGTPVQKVAAIDVGEGHVVENVEHEGYETVPQFVPEIRNPGELGSHQAATHDDIGVEAEDWRKHCRETGRRTASLSARYASCTSDALA